MTGLAGIARMARVGSCRDFLRTGGTGGIGTRCSGF